MFRSRLLGPALLLWSGLSACQAFRPFDSTSRPARFAYDPRYPVKMLAVEDLDTYAAAQQEPVWCWAACAAAVSDHSANQGRAREPVSPQKAARRQAEIVQRIQRRSKDRSTSEDAASKSEVLGALNVELFEKLLATEERVQSRVAQAIVDALMRQDDQVEPTTAAVPEKEIEPEPRPPHLGFDAERLYRDLKGDGHANPVIAAVRGEHGTGHVVIVSGACFQEIPRAAADPGATDGVEHRLMTVRVWDPTNDPPGATERFGGESWLAGSEFAARCDFLASRSSAEGYLAYLEEHAKWAERAFGVEPVAATEP
jgi:hypothetical protein